MTYSEAEADISEQAKAGKYPISMVCDVVELPRSYYYHQGVEAYETGLKNAIEEITGRVPTYGYCMIAQQIGRKPYELLANCKRARRIMDAKKLLRTVNKRKRRTTDSQHPYPLYPNLNKTLEITYPDQARVSDITYIRLLDDFVYLAIIIGVFTRALYVWCLSHYVCGCYVCT